MTYAASGGECHPEGFTFLPGEAPTPDVEKPLVPDPAEDCIDCPQVERVSAALKVGDDIRLRHQAVPCRGEDEPV
jgi:hypothetical protein